MNIGRTVFAQENTENTGKYRDTSPILRTAERTLGTVLRQVQGGPSASFVVFTRRVQCTFPILRLRYAPSVNLGQSPPPPSP